MNVQGLIAALIFLKFNIIDPKNKEQVTLMYINMHIKPFRGIHVDIKKVNSVNKQCTVCVSRMFSQPGTVYTNMESAYSEILKKLL